jgi:predicted nucleic acid-binding protein
MILVDTCIWADHINKSVPHLEQLVANEMVLGHSSVIGEIALGILKHRFLVLQSLRRLPQAPLCDADDVVDLMEKEALFGAGIGYVDAHLLASAKITSARLWTRDKRLKKVATRLNLAYEESV